MNIRLYLVQLIYISPLNMLLVIISNITIYIYIYTNQSLFSLVYLVTVTMPQSQSQEQEQYQVEKILKKKVTKDKSNQNHIFYLVHWKGYSKQEATWEPSQNLHNAIEKVQQFERKIWQSNAVQKSQQQQFKKIDYTQYSRQPQFEKHRNPLKKKKLKKLRDKQVQKQKKEDEKLMVQKLNGRQMKQIDQFEIIGAKKSEVVFYIKLPNGKIKMISSRQLQQAKPYKIIEFYQKHIRHIYHEDKQIFTNQNY